jgi:hypothetical protein
MKFEFQTLPAETRRRPVVPVMFPVLPDVKVLGLVDSGALGTRFDARWARELGLDLTQGSVEPFNIAGRRHLAYTLTIPLIVGRYKWNSRVSFAEDWTYSHAVLGLDGFFDNFVVRIDANRRETTLLTRR